MSWKKPEIYQTFLTSLKGGGVYLQFGKTPNYFRFFLVKASLTPCGDDHNADMEGFGMNQMLTLGVGG